jgi:hypothetical protein
LRIGFDRVARIAGSRGDDRDSQIVTSGRPDRIVAHEDRVGFHFEARLDAQFDNLG